MIGCYRLADVGNPEVYTAAVVAVLTRWTPEVIIAVTEPATGIPSKIKWLPSIAELTEACEAAYAPIERAKARQPLALPVPKVSDADRARVHERMTALANELRAKSAAVGFTKVKQAPTDDELRAYYPRKDGHPSMEEQGQ